MYLHTFDWQWRHIVVRSIEGRPFTLLQLQKDAWKEVERIQKFTVLKAMRQMNRTIYTQFQSGKMICRNGGQRLPVLPPKEKEVREKNKENDEDDISKTITLTVALPEEIIESQEKSETVLALYRLDADEEVEVLSCNINETKWASVIVDDSKEALSQESDTELQT